MAQTTQRQSTKKATNYNFAVKLVVRPRNRRNNPEYVLIQARVHKDIRLSADKKRKQLGHNWSEIMEAALQSYAQDS